MDKYAEIRVPISHDNPSIKRRENKCVLCGKCKDICKKQIGVAGYWKYDSEDIVCINCGQCANVCPMDAIVETDASSQFLQAVSDPTKKVVVMTSPAVRVSIGETVNMPAGEFQAGKMVSAIRKLGADFVFDVTFGADLTIMEEATELIDRIKNNKTLPQLTSCCPAWVKFVETFYPQYIPNLSSCKSPISMQASVIKNFFSKKINVKPSDIVLVAVTPCVAKKFEIKRPELSSLYGQDTDIVLSVRELGKLLKKQKINFKTLKESEFDSAYPTGSGAGVIFGASGGVASAMVRTAYYLTTGQNPPAELVNFKVLRGFTNVKTAKVNLLGKELNLCVVFGTANARKVLDKLKTKPYDVIEVMACPNGCVGGGGQPKAASLDNAAIARGESLFHADENMAIRFCHDNKEIKNLYRKQLISPLSSKAKKYLHTSYFKREK